LAVTEMVESLFSPTNQITIPYIYHISKKVLKFSATGINGNEHYPCTLSFHITN